MNEQYYTLDRIEKSLARLESRMKAQEGAREQQYPPERQIVEEPAQRPRRSWGDTIWNEEMGAEVERIIRGY
jgi:hypothetical protein